MNKKLIAIAIGIVVGLLLYPIIEQKVNLDDFLADPKLFTALSFLLFPVAIGSVYLSLRYGQTKPMILCFLMCICVAVFQFLTIRYNPELASDYHKTGIDLLTSGVEE